MFTYRHSSVVGKGDTSTSATVVLTYLLKSGATVSSTLNGHIVTILVTHKTLFPVTITALVLRQILILVVVLRHVRSLLPLSLLLIHGSLLDAICVISDFRLGTCSIIVVVVSATAASAR